MGIGRHLILLFFRVDVIAVIYFFSLFFGFYNNIKFFRVFVVICGFQMWFWDIFGHDFRM